MDKDEWAAYYGGSLDAPVDIYDIDYEIEAKHTISVEELAEKIGNSWFDNGWYK